MFEISIIKKYLVPKRKQLSVSLIGLMSIAVIALVVWLVLVFLSVTEGIERGWLQKLTSLNAPLRITPTKAYFQSYYHQIDSISAASNYTEKTIGEKAAALQSDPYNPEVDMEIPFDWPKAEKGVDPVKSLYSALENAKKNHSDLVFQDFEMSGAMLRLQLTKEGGIEGEQSFLTQASYLATYSNKSPYVNALILPPTAKDLNHLFYLTSQKISENCIDEPLNVASDTENFKSSLSSLLEKVNITSLKPQFSHYALPHNLLRENTSLAAWGNVKNGKISHLMIPINAKGAAGTLKKEKGTLYYYEKGKPTVALAKTTPLFVQGPLTFQAKLIPDSVDSALQLKDLHFQVKTKLQNKPLEGQIAWNGVEIASAKANKNLLTASDGVYLAKSFQEAGVKMGDRGYLAYSSLTASSLQEQRIPIHVVGFYDPGIMAVGNKCILVPPTITRAINTSSNAYNFDPRESNGVFVWFKDYKSAETMKEEIIAFLKNERIDKYWKVSTYKEYDFAKDLMQQFQSDKYLFTLVGVIILVVACSNIISLLIILVNDKKKEIGILQAMGASNKSIAFIFSACGLFMGVLGSLIGTCAALLTLHNIDSLVHVLSFLQGHEAFNAAFWGDALPNTLSPSALLFILISTPLISFFAALVPAIKACRIHTSSILRSE